jgi:predicted HD phosphohydrolase
MSQTFTRMDESTAEQWAVIGAETFQNQGRVAERVLGLLRSLEEITDGFATDQLTHCLQTATRAERDGADQEVVVASLCHDIGKAISVPNHPAIAAEILKSYVRPEVYNMIRVHQDFQGRHYYAHFGGDPDARPVGPGRLRPGLRHAPPRALRTRRPRGLRHPQVDVIPRVGALRGVYAPQCTNPGLRS